MCGIVAVFQSSDSAENLRKLIVQQAKRLRHRGPDWSGIVQVKGGAIAHERLAIVDPESGSQPLQTPDGKITLAVNGEIYNHESLRKQLKGPYTFSSKSDCEVILPLYVEQGVQCINDLEGMFAFVVFDSRDNSFFAARDHMGIIPLYIGWRADGGVCFSSELKAIKDDCIRFQIFPPGQIYDSKSCGFSTWYTPSWKQQKAWKAIDAQNDLLAIRHAFEDSVKGQIMSDVPWGVLLSGGLDSSLVAAVAVRHMQTLQKNGEIPQWGGKIHSFCIGLKDSPDLKAAQTVADHLGTIHHSFTYTIQEGLDALSDVIYHVETYDTTTIRAATPMFLMSRKIKALGVKMVLSGEGADEVFGGYLYFHKAPNAEEFHHECVRKLNDLYLYDCCRANKSTAAWGVEARVPFLGKKFLDVAMSIHPSLKVCKDPATGKSRMEKHCLRQAFDDKENPYLPRHVLWRQKEQFSDGVGYGWIDALRDLAEQEVTDQMMKQAKFLFPFNTPMTKENYFYRSTFMKHFPQQSAAATVTYEPSIACSSAAAVKWSDEFKQIATESNGECSGRAVKGIHVAAYENTAAIVSGKEKAKSINVNDKKTGLEQKSNTSIL
jgi:asparagine synthase (glutamine-hydrolysing)